MSTAAINTFTFPVTNANVRTLTDERGEPWFVAKDVINILGLYPSEYRRLDVDQKSYLPRTQLGLAPGRDYMLISESGLYKLIMRSDKPQAKQFQEWVTRDVLPSIRKNGGYIMGQEKIVTGEMSDLEFLAKAQTIAVRVLEQMTKERDALLAENAAMLPKAKRYDRFMDADGTLNLSQAAKALDLPSGRALGLILRRDLGWLFLDTTQVLPKASVLKKGYMTTKLWALDDRQKSGVQGRITAKGLEYLMEYFGLEEVAA